MTRYMVAAACASLALQFFMSTPTAQAAPPQQAGSARTSTGQVSSGTDAVKQGRTNPNHADALAALQDARATLARLTEASLSQDARDALASVSTNFRALYRAYTGEEPTPKKTAMEATKQPDPAWEKTFDALSSSVDRMLGPAPGHPGTVGTSGTASPSQQASSSRFELTTPVRQDFEAFRSQMQRFHAAASGRTSASVK